LRAHISDPTEGISKALPRSLKVKIAAAVRVPKKTRDRVALRG
jgi:hypothetical protein